MPNTQEKVTALNSSAVTGDGQSPTKFHNNSIIDESPESNENLKTATDKEHLTHKKLLWNNRSTDLSMIITSKNSIA